jgi:hypothetical protein
MRQMSPVLEHFQPQRASRAHQRVLEATGTGSTGEISEEARGCDGTGGTSKAREGLHQAQSLAKGTSKHHSNSHRLGSFMYKLQTRHQQPGRSSSLRPPSRVHSPPPANLLLCLQRKLQEQTLVR